MIGMRKTINDEIEKITFKSKEGEAAHQQIGRRYMDRQGPLISKLEPKNEQQAYFKTISLSLGEQIISSRWEVNEQMTSMLPWPLIIVLIL